MEKKHNKSELRIKKFIGEFISVKIDKILIQKLTFLINCFQRN